MSKKTTNQIEETMETNVTEFPEENIPEEDTVVEESKLKKVWQKIKKPLSYVGVATAGVILGNIIAGRSADEDMDFDCFEVDDVVETTEE